VIRTSISSSRWTLVAVAILLFGAGCNGPQPTDSRQVPSSNATASPNSGAETCPEAVATVVPGDLRLISRTIVPAGTAPGGVRVQFGGSGSRELTVLSGVAGELPGTDTGRRMTVRGHEAAVVSPGTGTLIIRWREHDVRAPCSQYAVVATELTQPELDAVISGVR
jgi:hypothetical protein